MEARGVVSESAFFKAQAVRQGFLAVLICAGPAFGSKEAAARANKEHNFGKALHEIKSLRDNYLMCAGL